MLTGTILGPYQIEAKLGEGGMGEVYRARDTRLNRLVALKVLRPEVAGDSDRLARFEREAQAVAALNHPNILTVHDVGVHAGTPYVVTELLEGENLREVVSHRAPTERQVLGWAVQSAHGLAAAHQKGIVHRDLKPENLFLTTDGRVKILDFGLAKQTGPESSDGDALTAASPKTAGMVMGTVAYMSPEQLEGRPVDAQSDLFSFGVVLYELLAKTNPFRRETGSATIGAILQEAPPPLMSVDPSIPRAVDGIVRRCIEKRREESVPGRARPGTGPRGRAGRAGGVGGARRGGGAEPVPRSGLLHRGGREPVLRTGGRGQGAVGQAPGAAAARGDRPVGHRQDIVRPRGRRRREARRLGGPRLHAGHRASARARAGARARPRNRPGGPAATRLLRRP